MAFMETIFVMFVFILIPLLVWIWICRRVWLSAKQTLCFSKQSPVYCTEPPGNLSPAAVAYLHRNTDLQTLFFIGFLSTAIKGGFQIEKYEYKNLFFKSQGFILHKRTPKAILSSEEEKILGVLKIGPKSKQLSHYYWNHFCNAKDAFKEDIQRTLRDSIFPKYKQSENMIWSAIFLAVFMGWVAANVWLPAIVASLMVIMAVIPVVRSLRAPTAEGRELLNRVAGFQKYLLQEIDRAKNGQLSPNFLESYLPYAFAVNITTNKKLKEIVKQLPANRKTASENFYLQTWCIKCSNQRIKFSELPDFIDNLFGELEAACSPKKGAPTHPKVATVIGGDGGGGGGGDGGRDRI